MSVEYRGKVRARDDLQTSWEAAAKQTDEKVDLIKASILTLYAAHGSMTDDELVSRLEAHRWLNPGVPFCTPQSVRTRRAALVLEGKVEQAGRGRSYLGNPATLWAAK
ncbi:hypothetical protein BH09ACT6_BH09ACT6_05940 [soil metagenome]